MADEHHDGGMSGGLIVVLALVVLFVLWMVMTGRFNLGSTDDKDTTINVELPAPVAPITEPETNEAQ